MNDAVLQEILKNRIAQETKEREDHEAWQKYSERRHLIVDIAKQLWARVPAGTPESMVIDDAELLADALLQRHPSVSFEEFVAKRDAEKKP